MGGGRPTSWSLAVQIDQRKCTSLNRTVESLLYKPTLQRHNTESSKQIFPDKELRGLSPNFDIHVFVSDLFIQTTSLPNLLQENSCGPILGIYKSLTDL
jgi:hypothetical protein